MNLGKVVWNLNPRSMKNFESGILLNLKFESRILPSWNFNLEYAVHLKFESRIPEPPLAGPYYSIVLLLYHVCLWFNLNVFLMFTCLLHLSIMVLKMYFTFECCRYRRSYDSDFVAPLVNHHIFPCLMQGGSVLIKGEAHTRRGASLVTLSQIAFD